MIEIPKELGYYMPGEWEKHSAVWLAWPYGSITFIKNLKEVEEDYCKIIKILQDSENVNLIVLNNTEKERIIVKLLQNQVGLSFLIHPK